MKIEVLRKLKLELSLAALIFVAANAVYAVDTMLNGTSKLELDQEPNLPVPEVVVTVEYEAEAGHDKTYTDTLVLTARLE